MFISLLSFLFLGNNNFFTVYLFHSNEPCFHSLSKIIINTIKNVIDNVLIYIFIFLFDINVGVRNEISMSKIKNIIDITIKEVVNVLFFLDINKNPLSKLLFLFFLLNVFSDIIKKIRAMIAITNIMLVYVIIIINLISF